MINNTIDKKYSAYYQSILQNRSKLNVQFVILTHIVSDVVEFVTAVKKIGEVALIIAIPYSKDEAIYQKLSKKNLTISPKLEALLDPAYLTDTVLKYINPDQPLIIIEIGGYFAPAITEIHKKTSGKLIGVVEDTEAGHRKYEALNDTLPCPVLSVARSHLKDAEHFLVSSACLNAAEGILKNMCFNSNSKPALVLGYGRIGQGLCQLLKEKNIRVSVYDSNPAKRLLALSRGYPIPEKLSALQEADLIFGATGAESLSLNDFYHIKNDAFLFSCSSKRIEFDLVSIKARYKKTRRNRYIDRYQNDHNQFYIAGDGQPVNFSCGKILVGPIISLVHGEMLAAITELSSSSYQNKLQEIPNHIKTLLAENWINIFCNTTTGTYAYE